MKLSEAKRDFIQTWGRLGAEWGINRTMAQVHALLLVTEEALPTDTIMSELQISRGNANTNLRALIDWGLIHKEVRPGERKEYFAALKDIWEVARRIAQQRKRRELDPLMRSLETLLSVDSSAGDQREVQAFRTLIKEILGLGQQADRLLALVTTLDQNRFFRPILRRSKG